MRPTVDWVAHASRVLLAASRRNNLCCSNTSQRKSVIAERDHQYARRVRYPKQCIPHVSSFVPLLWFRTLRRDDELLPHLQFVRIIDVIRGQ